jgi:hypothetical protein
MKKFLASCALSSLALLLTGASFVRATQGTPAQNGNDQGAQRQRVVGEVTAVDAAAGRVTVRTDSGSVVTLFTDEKTEYLRLPPGETAMDRAARATREDVHVGDRVLALDFDGNSPAGGHARRLVLMGRAGAAQAAREEGRRVGGRIVALDPAKKQIVIESRARGAFETLTLDASGDVRFLRFAPDSLRTSDARPASFADLKVGDSLRATGERSADGARFVPEEVITGSFTRVVGIVSAVDAARGEVTVRNEQTGQTTTLAVGPRSTLRRVTPEFARAVTERAERAAREAEQRAAGEAARGRQAGAGSGVRRGGEGERRGGAGLQQMFESLPAAAVADIRKGDAVVVTATPGADASRATAITLVTGGVDFLRRLQQLQRGTEGNPRRMSPGLPSDVLGGGLGNGNVNANSNAPPGR